MWVRTDVCAALCDRHRGRGPSAQVPPIKETGGVGVTKRPWRAGIEVIEVEPRWNRGGIEVEPARGEPLRTRIRSSARLRAPPPSYLHILSQSPHSDVSLLSPTLFLLRQFSLSILRKITSGRWGGGYRRAPTSILYPRHTWSFNHASDGASPRRRCTRRIRHLRVEAVRCYRNP